MKVQERKIQKLVLDNGEIPFDAWFGSLAEIRLQISVDSRLARVRSGNFGDFRSVGGGVLELRIPQRARHENLLRAAWYDCCGPAGRRRQEHAVAGHQARP